MTVTFSGPDEEFAASTGDNVNVTPSSSIFDNPPNAFSNLLITSNEGDSEPYNFELGDTYDLTWGGHGGGGIVDDAVVVRSGLSTTGDNVVVFEGTLEGSGEIVQIVWTPGFDLEQWYSDNYTPADDPQFYVEDIDENINYQAVCMAAQTLIATPQGVRELAHLQPGDLVYSEDSGAVPLQWVGARRVAGIGKAAPVLFETGTIGNDAPLRLSQQHRVLLAHPIAELAYGSSEVFVPAKSMINGHTIRLEPCPRITWMNVLTKDHNIIRAQNAAVETLFLGEMAKQIINGDGPEVSQYPTLNEMKGFSQTAARPILRVREAQTLIALIGHAPGQDVLPEVMQPTF